MRFLFMWSSKFGAAWVCALTLLSSGCTESKPVQAPGLPDILLVTVDTLRADHCTPYGYRLNTTPYFSFLANKGALFEAAYTTAATTAPAHASLMASVPPRSIPLLRNGGVLPDDFNTLAEVLAEKGYRTGSFTSAIPVMARYGLHQGFAHVDDTCGKKSKECLGRGRTRLRSRPGGETVDAAIDWMSDQRLDKPVFIWLHVFDPHQPYSELEPFRARWGKGTPRSVRKYDTEIRYADRHIGRLGKAMAERRRGLPRMMVVTADHGEGLGDHDYNRHGLLLYEEAARIPLIIHWPGRIEAGERITAPVSLIDVAPTILNLINVAVPSDYAGEDVLDEQLDPNRSVFLQRRHYESSEVSGRHVRGEKFAVIRGRDKLIFAPEEENTELYDLTADPGELTNLAESRPEAVQELMALLLQWQRRFKPSDDAVELLDDETRRALRALGYVD